MEGQLKNYRLRLIDGRIERFWKANNSFPDRWKELKKSPNGKGYYQLEFRFEPKVRTMIYYHRLIYWFYNQDWDIWDGGKDNKIDHTDRDTHNNKIENLECVSQQQNCFNRNTKGYTFHDGKYQATITRDDKKINIGNFDTAEEAHNAYLLAKAIHHQ